MRGFVWEMCTQDSRPNKNDFTIYVIELLRVILVALDIQAIHAWVSQEGL